MIVFAAIVPHPPESVPGVGTEKALKAIQKTAQSFEVLREGLEQVKPDTVIVISPHCRMEPYSFVINSESNLSGSFENFDLDEVLSFANDLETASKIAFDASMNDLPTHLHPEFLDYGALIPLYHLLKNIRPKVVHLSFSMLDYGKHLAYGDIIRLVCQKPSSPRVAIIASGDLSHKLTPDAPAGYSSAAQQFDKTLIHLLGENDIASILGIHEDYAREMAECGLRSILILLGALQGTHYKFKLLSYEGPFGVGYLAARLL